MVKARVIEAMRREGECLTLMRRDWGRVAEVDDGFFIQVPGRDKETNTRDSSSHRIYANDRAGCLTVLVVAR